jgi:hypothetical protein
MQQRRYHSMAHTPRSTAVTRVRGTSWCNSSTRADVHSATAALLVVALLCCQHGFHAAAAAAAGADWTQGREAAIAAHQAQSQRHWRSNRHRLQSMVCVCVCVGVWVCGCVCACVCVCVCV